MIDNYFKVDRKAFMFDSGKISSVEEAYSNADEYAESFIFRIKPKIAVWNPVFLCNNLLETVTIGEPT